MIMATETKLKPAADAPRKTKIGTVIQMLGRKNGANLDEIAKSTGWQKHTIRAALTGLKKQGHTIERTTVGTESRYSIARPNK